MAVLDKAKPSLPPKLPSNPKSVRGGGGKVVQESGQANGGGNNCEDCGGERPAGKAKMNRATSKTRVILFPVWLWKRVKFWGDLPVGPRFANAR